jgi:hypothetical protein
MKGEKWQMKANLITSFATGLLVSAGVCGIVYFSQSPEVGEKSNKPVVEVPSVEEMKTTLSTSGYIILTEKELEEELAAVQPVEEPKKESSKEEEIVYRTIVNVAPGMTSIDVGNALVHGKIIDNARIFFDEVEKRGLSNQLKPGTFELDSNMTVDEVVKVIFKL